MGWTTKQQNKTTNRFDDSKESMSLSYILLCNSLALRGIESIFGMAVLWDDRHQLIMQVSI